MAALADLHSNVWVQSAVGISATRLFGANPRRRAFSISIGTGGPIFLGKIQSELSTANGVPVSTGAQFWITGPDAAAAWFGIVAAGTVVAGGQEFWA